MRAFLILAIVSCVLLGCSQPQTEPGPEAKPPEAEPEPGPEPEPEPVPASSEKAITSFGFSR